MSIWSKLLHGFQMTHFGGMGAEEVNATLVQKAYFH